MKNPEIGSRTGVETVNEVVSRKAPEMVEAKLDEAGCTPDEKADLKGKVVDDFRTWISRLFTEEEYAEKITDIIKAYRNK